MDHNELAALIRTHDSILVTSHQGPDGDSIGSEAALCTWLREQGKTACALNEDDTPAELAFIDTAGAISRFIPENGLPEATLLIGVDAGVSSRFPVVWQAAQAAGMATAVIDHHVPEAQTLSGLIDQTASSTGEILYRFFKESGRPLSPAAAAGLLYAIGSDTGWMRFANTSPAILAIMAELAETAGIPLAEAYRNLHCVWTEDRFRFYTEVMATLRIEHNDIAVISCSQDMLAQYPSLGTMSAATDRFIDDLKRLKQVQIMALIRQSGDRTAHKVSLRSNGTVDVQQIAAAFGGGGHKRAAGCTIHEPDPGRAHDMLMAEIARQQQ